MNLLKRNERTSYTGAKTVNFKKQKCIIQTVQISSTIHDGYSIDKLVDSCFEAFSIPKHSR